MGYNPSGKIGLLAGVLLTAVSSAKDPWTSHEWVAGITDAEVVDMRSAAVHGDSDAAYKVATVYSYPERYSFIDHFFYLRLAAEQGNCAAIIELDVLLTPGKLRADFSTTEDWSVQARRCRAELRPWKIRKPIELD